MASIHGLQNLVVSALQRDMKIGAEFFRGCEKVKQFITDGRGFDGRNADTVEIGDSIESPKQGAKVQALMSILTDIHAGKHNLSVASSRQALNFAHKVFERSAALMPSGERNNAETAHRATAVLYLQQGAGGIRLGKVREIEVVARHRLGMAHLHGRSFP